MKTIAYVANLFPATVEWYVVDEVRELRRRGAHVITVSARAADPRELPSDFGELARQALVLWPMRWQSVWSAFILAICNAPVVVSFLRETLAKRTRTKRLRALAHTALAISLATRLRGLAVEHIHVHHGFYSSWIAMVAARLLGIPFSVTLHGSDLLLHPAYLDTKLEQCAFCITISEFNRRHILAHFPQVDPGKVLVQRLGVEIPVATVSQLHEPDAHPLILISVGRLHPVKNHSFLIQACFFLKEIGVQFQCWIVGEGPERSKLEFLIRELNLCQTVRLVGEVPHSEVGRYYELADLVVLTSQSEGIPLALMEAMARAKLVLAPAITGIPELVLDGKTGFLGFLYQPGALEEFVWRVDQIARSLPVFSGIRHAAREQVRAHFEREKNLDTFVTIFFQRLGNETAENHADPVLQQI